MRMVANSSSAMGEMGAFSFSPSMVTGGPPERLDSSDQLNGWRSRIAIRREGGDDAGHGRECAVGALAG
jgi:hypothetical protein